MRLIWYVALALAIALPPLGKTYAADDGIVRIKSAYSMPETIKRLKKDVAHKGIMFFDEIDQSKLAADAGVTLRPSTLLVFGNPPLGTLFLTSNPAAGLDWPVRLLVIQDERGDVYTVYRSEEHTSE